MLKVDIKEEFENMKKLQAEFPIVSCSLEMIRWIKKKTKKKVSNDSHDKEK